MSDTTPLPPAPETLPAAVPAGLPGSVVVVSTRYTIRCSPASTNDMRARREDHSMLGMFEPQPQLITLAHDQGPDSLRVALVHELLHASMWEAGLRSSVADEAEEAITAALAGVVLEIVRRNPELVRFLGSLR